MLLEGASPSAFNADGPAAAHQPAGYRRRSGQESLSSGSGSSSTRRGSRRARRLIVGAAALLGLSSGMAFHQPLLARPPSLPTVPSARLPLRPLHPRPLPTAASPLASPTALPHYLGPHQHHAPEVSVR